MTTAAVVILALAAWVAFLYAWPFGPCPKCHGSGHIPRADGRRVIVCPRCKGLKRVQRPGSRTVHRLARSLRAEAAGTRTERAERASPENGD
jgi:hypothetical protein